MNLRDNKVITVCNACLCATCWHGLFLCNESRNAGTVEKKVRDLKKLNLEHPKYWSIKHLNKVSKINGVG